MISRRCRELLHVTLQKFEDLRIFRYTEERRKKPAMPRIGADDEFESKARSSLPLNGGPLFKFNESISFVINCETQEEVDYFWGELAADGGEESQCGWLKDKFVFVQVTQCVDRHVHDKDPEKADEHESDASNAEIEIPKLKAAYDGNDSFRQPWSNRSKAANHDEYLACVMPIIEMPFKGFGKRPGRRAKRGECSVTPFRGPSEWAPACWVRRPGQTIARSTR